jgi:retinol dehydrogenase 12
MTKTICLITGATSGIGKATAMELAKRGMHIVFTTRNDERGKKVQQEIIEKTHNPDVDVMQCDLASFASIQSFAIAFQKKYDSLHILINNAGVWETKRKESKDGIEMTFAVNHLAPFLLTHLLLGLIKRSAPSRIINVASGIHPRGHIDFDDLEAKKSFSGMAVYANSKLANILFTKELSEQLKGTKITVNCLHPGVVKTNLLRNSLATRAAFNIVGITPEKGAETSVYLATSLAVGTVSGEYFSNKHIEKSSTESMNRDVGKRLWQISEKYLKDFLTANEN